MTVKPSPMKAEVKARMVKACRETFQRIAYDLLLDAENHWMAAEEVQDYVAEYVDTPGWWQLTYEHRHECLAEAIPNDQAI